MCGIVGGIGDLSNKEINYIKFLFEIDTTRGSDSSGIVFINNLDNSYSLHKRIGTPWDLYNNSKNVTNSSNFGWNKKITGVICHNRFATVGCVNNENAHPFKAGNIIGVHNGTLSKFSYDNLKREFNSEETDSKLLFRAINKNGVKNTLNDLWGAWATVFYSMKTKSFYMFKNEERPLYLASFKNKEVILFASEKWMLKAVEDKFNIFFEEIVSLKNDTLFEINYLNNKLIISEKENLKSIYINYYNDYYQPDFNKKEDSYSFLKDKAYKENLNLNGKIAATFDVGENEKNAYKYYLLFRSIFSNMLIRVLVNEKNRQEILNKIIPLSSDNYFTLEPVGFLNYLETEKSSITANSDNICSVPKKFIKTEQLKFEKDKKKVIKLYTIGSEALTEDKLQEKLNNGCLNCGKQLSIEDLDKIKWVDLSSGVYLCDKCSL